MAIAGCVAALDDDRLDKGVELRAEFRPG